MTIDGYRMATVDEFVGKELGVSDWIMVDQSRIDEFAHCTNDSQWIHVDAPRAALESPFGSTIAHGFLSLSLIGGTNLELDIMPPDAAQMLNYGLDRVRFMAPVKAGARVRNRVDLLGAEAKGPGRVLITTRHTFEIEGQSKPALVAEVLLMLVAPPSHTQEGGH